MASGSAAFTVPVAGVPLKSAVATVGNPPPPAGADDYGAGVAAAGPGCRWAGCC